ncbi:MAG: 16S rRNA (uracil(1498)-N(3))-methyltransferase [Bacteroidetes bacterium]|nr:16S rRNA (uracil(1498)-N(3))-methyltransferase [Bacteroidota bacterium]
MHLFYTSGISSDSYVLSEEESKHCIKVLRLSAGGIIQLIDGIGGWYEAEIIDDNPKRCTVNVIQSKKNVGKRNWQLHIAIAPTKSMDRLEWFVEKATEIGIDEISLIDCTNSERAIVKADRLHKVVVSAIKQSLKAYLPKVNEIVDFKKFIVSSVNFKGQKFIAHCNSLPSPSGEGLGVGHLKSLYQKGNNVLVLIGPEGDFSPEEIKLSIENDFKEISLGESRLRTETAALYACTAMNILNE